MEGALGLSDVARAPARSRSAGDGGGGLAGIAYALSGRGRRHDLGLLPHAGYEAERSTTLRVSRTASLLDIYSDPGEVRMQLLSRICLPSLGRP